MADYMDNTPEMELDWDSEISNEGGFVLLPEGDYPYEIKKMERTRYNGSSKVPPCRMAQLTVLVHGGDKGDTTVTYKLFLLARFQWKIFELFVSAGLAKADDQTIRMQWDRVEGAKGICHVGVREYTKQSGPHAGETGTANEITKFLPPAAPKAVDAPSWQQGALF